MPADIFSLAITMYEVFAWEEAYNKKDFKFPWKIAEFVSSGLRLEKANNISTEQFELIQKCWSQKVNERLTIDEIIGELNQMILSLEEKE